MSTLPPCGHPAVVVHTADDGTQHCPACEAEARAAEPACPSCGVAYVDHLGLHGTCAALVDARADVDAIRAAIPAYILAALGVDDGQQCQRCQGIGRRTYGTTATWRSGGGGAAMTVGVCDACWGSGTAEPWPSLREQEAEVQRLSRAVQDVELAVGLGEHLVDRTDAEPRWRTIAEAVAAVVAERDRLEGEVRRIRSNLWPLATALGITGEQPDDWQPNVTLLIECACKELVRSRAKAGKLREEVERLRAITAAEWGESGLPGWEWNQGVWSRALGDGREHRVWREDDSMWAHGCEEADTWGVTVYAGRHRWALDAMTAADERINLGPDGRPVEP